VATLSTSHADGAAGPDAPSATPGRRPLAWRRALVPGIPALVTLIVVLWDITGSSYWRDEAASMTAVDRPFGQLLRMLGSTDSPHGAYYMILWVVVRLGGTGEFVTRLPSALAMAAAAAATAAIGRRLVSPLAGLAAGLVLAVLPPISLLGQNARPDAITIFLAALASYLLVRIMQVSGPRRGWVIGYAACLTALGLIDIFAVFLVAAHAITVAVTYGRTADRAAAKALALSWLRAAVPAVLLVVPLVWLTYTEKAQARWIPKPSVRQALLQYKGVFGSPSAGKAVAVPFALCLLALLAIGVLAGAAGGRAALAKRWPLSVPALCLPWLIVPGALLLLASALLAPVFYVRYLMFGLPALALLAGTAIAAIASSAAGAGDLMVRRLSLAAGVLALVVLAAVGLPAQAAVRTPAGHGEDIRRIDQIIAADMRHGDALVFVNRSDLDDAYPYGFRQLRNIGLGRTDVQNGTLNETLAPAAVIHQRMQAVSRVWLVYRYQAALPADPLRIINGQGFRLVRSWHVLDLHLFLYARPGS
jgi:mannosyltransferase